MHQDDHPARKAVVPRRARQDNAVVDDRQGRQITRPTGRSPGRVRWCACSVRRASGGSTATTASPPRSPISDTGCCSTDLDYPVVI